MSEGGRCEAHDNWHAHCQQCCRETISALRDIAKETSVLLSEVRRELKMKPDEWERFERIHNRLAQACGQRKAPSKG